jgi:hypothetical protein
VSRLRRVQEENLYDAAVHGAHSVRCAAQDYSAVTVLTLDGVFSAAHRMVCGGYTMEQMQTDNQPGLLTFFRAIAGPGFIIGGWQLMSASFGWGLFIVYAGFVICIAECIYEPELLRKPFQIQIGLIGAIFLLATIFTIDVALIHAPIEVSALAMGPAYNLSPAGISWKPFYTELDVIIANQTDMNYQNLNVLVRPDSPVADIGQDGNIGSVSFKDRYGVISQATIANPETGEVIREPLMATDAGYTVYCPELPPHISLQIVLAISGIVPSSPPNSTILQGGRIPGSPLKESIHFTVTIPDTKEGNFHYWYGNKDNAALWIANTEAKKVTVRGSYIVGHRSIDINKDVVVKKVGQ